MIWLGVASPAAIFSTIGTSVSCVFPGKRSAVGFKEKPRGEKGGSLVAIRQRVIASQVLNQNRRLLYERGICVLTAKACLRCSEGRIGERNPRQARDLLGSRSE